MSDRLDDAGYDAWFDTRWGSYAFHVERQALLAAAGPLAGREVADIGCGTGRFTAVPEDAGARVVGIDLDPAMLEIADTRVSGRLLAGDAHQLPLADDTVDMSVVVTPGARRCTHRARFPAWRPSAPSSSVSVGVWRPLPAPSRSRPSISHA